MVQGLSGAGAIIAGGTYKQAPSYTIYKTGVTYYARDADGTVTYSNADFHTVWNSCGADLTAAGGTVFLKKGAYLATDILYLYSNVDYVGEGFGSHITVHDTASDGLTDAWSGAVINYGARAHADPVGTQDVNILVQGIRFEGHGATQEAKNDIMEIRHAKNITIRDCIFHNAVNPNAANGNWGFMISGEGTNNETKDILIENCVGYTFSFDAFQCKGAGCKDITFKNCVAYDSDSGYATYLCNGNIVFDGCIAHGNIATYNTGGYGQGFAIQGTPDCLITNSVSRDNCQGVVFSTVGGTECHRAKLVNTFIKDNVTNTNALGCVQIDLGSGGSGLIDGCTVFITAAYGQWVVSLNGDGGHTIKNSVFTGYFSSHGGIYSTGATSDNLIEGCSFYDTDTRYSIYFENAGALRNIIRNCRFMTGRGIRLVAGVNYTVIEGNIFAAGLATTITDAGTGTMIRRNSGYLTENSGASAIPSGAALHVHVAHGLALTPTKIRITPTAKSTADPTFYVWVDNIGAAEFIVNCAVDPGVLTLPFLWEAEV